MTGKDIIMFILKNDLVDEKIFTDELFNEFFVDVPKVAEHFGVGIATINVMYELGTIDGFMVDEKLYFPKAILGMKGDSEVNEK